jgi:outer membrane protein OmpA-like peptidoglycan-associated protein
MAKRLLLCLAASAALSARAGAADDPTMRGFDADASRYALSLDGGFVVETAAPSPQGAFRLAALLDLADGLLTMSQGAEQADLVGPRLALHLLASKVWGPVELSAHLPLVLHQQSDLSLLTDQGVTGPLVAPIAATTLGDLRLGVKYPFAFLQGWPVALAALVDLRLPSGDGDAFTSDGLTLSPSLLATWTSGKLRLDGQAGWLFRSQGQYAQLVVDDSFTFGAGAQYDLPPRSWLPRWKALLEVAGSVPVGFEQGSDRYRAPLAARAGLRGWLTGDLSVEAGLGVGLGEPGYGHERWRVFAGVRWGRTPVGPPDEDADKDGVPNAKDACPTVPGRPELDGCPDDDGDGIPNPEDRCPQVPGPAENDGCPPEQGAPLVEIEAERLALKDSIHFDTARDTIKPESFPVLDQVARLLADHPELRRVRVEGHTDNVGAAAYNKELSARRAASVVRYLVGKGVAAERLAAAGYGFERPIATNETALGRAKNRRVEFTMQDQRAPPLDK